MVKHKHTSIVCGIIVVAMLAVTVLLCFAEGLGIEVVQAEMPYASRLFSTDRVHTLDIVVDESDWQGILDNATAKEYISATVVIDGEKVSGVGIRTKGNSSLSTIASSGSDRYSFKIEFDHYVNGKTYYGLDKLALNNIAQDNTYLKDYLSYQMMGYFGADAPLCSFIYITVNGEDWGLYLAVEGIEEAFAERNYGSDYGQIYKPDNMDMNGNRGGGDDAGGGFEMPGMGGFSMDMDVADLAGMIEGGELSFITDMMDEAQIQEILAKIESGEITTFEQVMESAMTNGFPQMPGGDMQMPGGQFGAQGQDMPPEDAAQPAQEGDDAQTEGTARDRGGMMGMMGGADDVALRYVDDDPDSYPNIFDNAQFDPTDQDKARLIASLKQLGEGENLEEVVNIDEVLRYFVVHNYLLNFDSYTGTLLHNYYLYEEDGQLSMIAWDYNLAFGAFSMGGGSSGVTSQVNYPIDTPTSGSDMSERPMLGQLLGNETYLAQYHELFDEFIASYFESGVFEAEFDAVVALISPYVEKDPTAFCTYEEFETAIENLREFCLLRAESIRGQLEGTIPATSEGQAADSSNFVDGSSIDLQAMGSQNSGFEGGRGGGWGQRGGQDEAGGGGGDPPAQAGEEAPADEQGAEDATTMMSMPTDMDMGQMPEGFTPPEGMSMPSEGMQMPEGMTPPEGMALPEGFEPSSGFPAQTGQATAAVEETGEAVPPEDATADSQALPADTPAAANEAGAATAAPEAPAQERTQGGFQMPGMGRSTQESTSTLDPYLLLGIAAGILLIGLAFAILFKR